MPNEVTDIDRDDINSYAVNKEAVVTCVDQFTNDLNNYLEILGLPSERVLVETQERKKVINNLQDIINAIPSEKRSNSLYLSAIQMV